jgi:ABC-type antimicrobial peptide transport system permease subunit
MGIRIALGAQPAAVVRLVLREGMAFPVVGLVAGFAASLALARVVRASLYQTAPTDPVILTVTIAVLLAISAVACLAPARRATRVDPLEALRAD